jgi:hypothetical protein
MYGYTYGYPSGGGAGAVSGFESAVLSDGGWVVGIGNTTDLYSRLLGLGLINSASLVNSCNGGKADALYNFVPSPVQALDRFTVTRASTKLRIGSNGLYGSVANNVPAFEFNTDGTYRGLSVEPGATNLAIWSQDFTQAAWNKTVSASVTGDTGIAPDGTMTADTFTAGANGSQIQQSFVGAAGVTYTASFFIRRVTGTGVVNIRSVENTNTPITITSSWARYSLAVTSTTTTIRIGLTLGTSGDAVEIWQAQLETGSVATSPIVTTAGTASRVADVVSLTGASSLIGQSAGVIYAEIVARNFNSAGQLRRIVAVSDGTLNNRIAISSVLSQNNRYQGTVHNGGVATAQIIQGSDVAENTVIRLAIAYATDDVAFYINGSSIGTDASSAVPACSRIDIGGILGSDQFINGHIRSVALFPTRLANATLASLTA